MNKKIINMLFSDMCCSECRADFDENSVFTLRKEKNLTVLQIVCQRWMVSFVMRESPRCCLYNFIRKRC